MLMAQQHLCHHLQQCYDLQLCCDWTASLCLPDWLLTRDPHNGAVTGELTLWCCGLCSSNRLRPAHGVQLALLIAVGVQYRVHSSV